MRSRQLKVEPPFRIETNEEMWEWEYIYQERLGMLVGEGDYTPEEDAMARKDADDAVKRMRKPI